MSTPAEHLCCSVCLQLTRPVVFPEADMKTLNTLNNSLLSLGAVKRNADE